jgi:hypothetical protein
VTDRSTAGFKELAALLLEDADEFLHELLPGGRMVGAEYCCSSIDGGDGNSFKVNTKTGKWSEFAGDDMKGGDLISLYATKKRLSQTQAAKQLCRDLNVVFKPGSELAKLPPEVDETGGDDSARVGRLTPPPIDVGLPPWQRGPGHAVNIWVYRSVAGEILFYIARYDQAGGRKTFLPWSWDGDQWVNRAWPTPRPLFGLELLADNPAGPVLIVEGEKAADAARDIVGDRYVVVSWQGGAMATSTADWSPLRDRTVMIWPDADIPGAEAATKILALLSQICPKVSVLSTAGKSNGWDAADAQAEGWDEARFSNWTNLDAAEATDPSQASHRVLPLIRLDSRDLSSFSDAGWRALVAANAPPSHFLHGDVPVRLDIDESGDPRLTELNQDRLRHILARVARWSLRERSAYPDKDVIKDMLAAGKIPLPPINQVYRVPFIASDRHLVTTAGYYAPARAYYSPPKGFMLPPVPEDPAPAETRRARDLLYNELLGDFPFVSEAERAHSIALLILAFVRGLIDGPTPLHLIEAPTAGTGKGLLLEVLWFICIGRMMETLTQGVGEDDWRKKITSKLMEGGPMVAIDNLHGSVDSAALAAVLTSPVWTDRVLGGNKMISVPVQVIWAGTANNVALSQELTRRTIRIRLDAKVDQPWRRTGFRHANLRQWVRQNRTDLVHAILVLVRAWISAGCPEYKDSVLGSYERWSSVVGGILQVAGIPEFLGNLSDFYGESDAEGAGLRALIGAWQKAHGTKVVTAAKLWGIALGLEESLDLGQGNEKSQKTKFGKLIVSLRDRRFGGLRVAAAGLIQGAKQWRLADESAPVNIMNVGSPERAAVNKNNSKHKRKKKVHDVHRST